jgi:hypothetical protein
MGLAGQDGGTDGYEPVPLKPDQPAAAGQPRRPGAIAAALGGPAGTALFRRRSAHPSRRGVLHLQTSRDSPVPPDLASWFTERGFHFYVAAVRWPRAAARPAGVLPAGRRPGSPALAATFTELDSRCQHLRTADGIENVIVTAAGEGALAAALWCATPLPGSQPDALILYAPAFGGAIRRGLDIRCPVLVVGGGTRGPRPLRRAAAPAAAASLGRHVTWLRPTDGEARPDARDPADRSRFFDEMGRWLGAYMYGPVRDQLL